AARAAGRSSARLAVASAFAPPGSPRVLRRAGDVAGRARGSRVAGRPRRREDPVGSALRGEVGSLTGPSRAPETRLVGDAAAATDWTTRAAAYAGPQRRPVAPRRAPSRAGRLRPAAIRQVSRSGRTRAARMAGPGSGLLDQDRPPRGNGKSPPLTWRGLRVRSIRALGSPWPRLVTPTWSTYLGRRA